MFLTLSIIINGLLLHSDAIKFMSSLVWRMSDWRHSVTIIGIIVTVLLNTYKITIQASLWPTQTSHYCDNYNIHTYTTSSVTLTSHQWWHKLDSITVKKHTTGNYSKNYNWCHFMFLHRDAAKLMSSLLWRKGYWRCSVCINVTMLQYVTVMGCL
jgi:hypothetical protein